LAEKAKYAILTLLLLSPFTAEVLTGATSLLEFINPVILGILVSLYGLGALLIREARIRLNIGYSGVLLLGFVYGIIEEGIAVKSFFDPHWKDLGIFGVYGRWMGVNWVWSLYLTIFHSVWSILAPIIIVEALYPSIMDRQWIGRRGLILSILIFSIDIIVINLILTKYQPSSMHYLACFIVIIMLIYTAYKLRKHIIIRELGISPKHYGFYWMLWGSGFFAAFYIVSSLIPLPLIPIIIGLLIGYASYILVKKLDSSRQNNLYRYWLYTGVVVPLLFIDILQALQLNIERLTVTVITIVMLIVMYRNTK